MDIKNIAGLTIGLVVGVLLFAAILVPAISDAQKDLGNPATIDNTDGGLLYNSYEMGLMSSTTPNVTIKVDNSTLIVNGETVPISHYGTLGQIAVCEDGSYLAVRSNGAALYFYQVTSEGYSGTTISTGTEVTVSYNGISFGEDSFTFTQPVYCIGVQSDDTVVRFTSITGLVVKDIDDLFGTDELTIDGNTVLAIFHGDEVTVSGYSAATVSYTMTLVDGYTDLYSIESYSIEIPDVTISNNVWIYIGPADVNGHEAAGPNYSLVGVIPILVIVGLILVAVRFLAFRE